ncbi:MAG: hypothetical protein IKE03_01965 [Blautia sp.]|nr:hypothetical protein [Blautia sp.]
MESPIITRYYKEPDPVKRRRMLEEAIASGEGDPRENEIRQELYRLRYQGNAQGKKDVPADGFLALWMTLEYNRNTGRGFFGADMRRAVKEIRGHLERLKFKEYQEKGGLESELFYKEVCHMVRIYIDLCATDHSYNSTIFGMFRMGADQSKNKIMADVRDVAVRVPETLELQEELAIVTKAAAEVYEEAFPYEGGLF